MWEVLTEVIIICLILSIDVAIISFNYGISKIKMPFISALSIALINLIISGVGVIISFFISNYINEKIIDYISCFLLFLLGFYYLIKIYFLKPKEKNLDTNNDNLISPIEAVLFALLLTPDGFCVGLSACENSMFILLFMSLFFITTFLSVYFSSILGYKLSKKIKLNLDWLSPICLILFAVVKFLLLII